MKAWKKPCPKNPSATTCIDLPPGGLTSGGNRGFRGGASSDRGDRFELQRLADLEHADFHLRRERCREPDEFRGRGLVPRLAGAAQRPPVHRHRDSRAEQAERGGGAARIEVARGK